ncbi:MAG TPA: DUF881 domain-containing protein [Actinomycetaceae bacterium]|nr:DUF881 domain-containing protein [Actinomycetaceae bacterium]
MSDRKTPSGGGGRRFWTRVLIAVLCGLVAFAAVVQARQRETDTLSTLRQAELVRILDELSTRVEELTSERDTLSRELADLESGVISQTAAAEAAAERVRALSIHAGTIPVHGPGVALEIRDPQRGLKAQSFVSLVEELRNSGAEAIEINDVRLGTNSWFADDEAGISLDGIDIAPPYTVDAIGDPGTIAVALEMPGGVLAAFRTAGAATNLEEIGDIEIHSVRDIPALEHAEIVE